MNLIGTVITGRLIGWLVVAWLLSLVLGLGGLWLYMDGSRDAAVAAAGTTATATANAACAEADKAEAEAQEQAVLAAVRRALAERALAQAEVDLRRDAEQAALRKEVEAAKARANQLSSALRRHIDANPLPASWRLDAERVRLFNAARRRGTDPSSAADRRGLSGLPGSELPGAAAPRAFTGWDSERGWAAVAGGLGWRDQPGVLGGVAGVPGLRSPGAVEGRDPLKLGMP